MIEQSTRIYNRILDRQREPLSAALTQTLITSYDIQNRQPVFFKSWREDHRSMQMKHAARATSAAPTYFEPALVPVGLATRALIDGGVFINSPSVSAYAEAKKIFPEESDFFVLSLGTGELIRPIAFAEAKTQIRTHKAEIETECGHD